MFDPFFTTKEVGSGTGLGLSICHGIITAHRGRIYAESDYGHGATFVVELPVLTVKNETHMPKLAEDEPWQDSTAKLLIVDDELAILDFLKSLLTEQGYQVETANRAQAALEKLQSKRYDLVLLDVKLPGMGGINLYHRIEAQDPGMAGRILFITGDVMETKTRDFLYRTKRHYIAKPFDIEELTKEVSSLLGRTP